MADPFDDRPEGRLERLLEKLPGFGGYVDREARQTSDHLARTQIADHLQAAKRSLDKVTRDLVDKGAIDLLPRFDRFRSTVDHAMAKLRGAFSGSCDFFAVDEVADDLLDDIYEHDLWMIDEAERFAKTIESLANAMENPADLLSDVEGRFEVIQQKIAEREKLIRELR